MILNPLNGVYGSLIKFGLVVALILSLYGGYRYELHKSFQEGVKTTEIKYKAEILAQNEILNLKKKSAEKQLEQDLAKIKGINDAKIKTLTTDRDTLLSSLQHRPERPASNSSTNPSTNPAESSTGATGAGLYLRDAEFLARLSADTETLKLGLIQCYAEYETIKKSVESFTKDK